MPGAKRIGALLAALLLLAACTSIDFDEAEPERFDMLVAAYASGNSPGMAVPGQQDAYQQREMSAGDDAPADAPVESGEVGGAPQEAAAVAVALPGRKIISTVDIRMESRRYDVSADGIRQAVEQLGGYIEQSDITGSLSPGGGEDEGEQPQVRPASDAYSDGGDRSLYYRIRVPQEALPAFLQELETFGNVLSKQESAEDVTLDYVDNEAHIEALRAEQAQLLALLERSDSIDDIIKLQQRLSEVRYQLESYESQMRVLQNQVSYATVNLRLYEVVQYTDLTNIQKLTVPEKMAKGFSTTLGNIGDFFVNLLVWLVANLPYLLIAAALLAGAALLIRRSLRRRDNRQDPSLVAAESADPAQHGQAAESKKKQVTQARFERLKHLFAPPFKKLDKIIAYQSIAGGFVSALILFCCFVYANVGYLVFEAPMGAAFSLLFLLAFLAAFLECICAPLLTVVLLVRWLLIPRDGGPARLRFRSQGTFALICLQALYLTVCVGAMFLLFEGM